MIFKQKIVPFLLALALFLGLAAPAMAAKEISAAPSEKMININALSVITDKDIISGYEVRISRDQRSYWKSVTLRSVHDKMDPTLEDWPQTVYYSEPNPYAPGNAQGTLHLQSMSKVPGSISSWNLTYTGYMFYYD